MSALIAMFVGGWISARFAGIPNNVDGMLHGLLTWGVVTLVTVFLLTTTIGRLLSGTATLIGQGLHLAGQVTQTAVQGAANVAQGAANVARNAAQTAGETAQDASQDISHVLQTNPQVREAMNKVDLSMNNIMEEAKNMLREAGIAPEQIKEQAQSAVQDVKGAVQTAASNPQEAEQQLSDAMQRVFNKGQQVVSQADRQSLIDIMKTRMNMDDQKANEMLNRWEGTFVQSRHEANRVINEARMKMEDMRDQVEQKVEEVKYDVDRTARHAVKATSDAIAKIAGAAFAAIIISALAAGLGGLLGAPEALPTAEIEDQNTSYMQW